MEIWKFIFLSYFCISTVTEEIQNRATMYEDQFRWDSCVRLTENASSEMEEEEEEGEMVGGITHRAVSRSKEDSRREKERSEVPGSIPRADWRNIASSCAARSRLRRTKAPTGQQHQAGSNKLL